MSATLAPDNDFALLARFTNTGDEEAFAEIVKRYAGVVYATSFRVTHDRARAEDVSQEVFFRLLRKPQAVSQSLGGWLHQCATRLALDEMRSETARKRREANRRIETNEVGQASTWQEISPHVDEALAELPEESRELLVSHFLQGKSQSTIAVETRTSPATISRRMRDAVVELRAQLRRRGVAVAPALLVGLCRMNAPAQAAALPATLTAELGKMAIVGSPAATAGVAWLNVSAWCDAAANKWGWPAEMVKQTVAAAATSAVALVAGLLIANAVIGSRNATRPQPVEERNMARGTSGEVNAQASKPQPKAQPQDVRVAPAGERGSRTVVLFRWPESTGGSLGVTFGDGRSVPVPPTLARKVIENQAGKTLEQLSDESRKSSPSLFASSR